MIHQLRKSAPVICAGLAYSDPLAIKRGCSVPQFLAWDSVERNERVAGKCGVKPLRMGLAWRGVSGMPDHC
jgi:hypothetical protein